MPAADLFEVFTSVQGEGTFIGRRQIFVRFAGCNLECPYCDTKYALSKPHSARFENTPLSSKFYEERNPIPAFRLNEYIDLAFTLDQAIHSISLTGGEPLMQDEFIEFFLRTYKKGRTYMLETNGSLPERLEKVIDFIDFFSIDIKLPYLDDETFLERQKNFFSLIRNRPSQAKIVVTKGDTAEVCEKICAVLTDASQDLPIILQPDTKAMPHFSLLASFQRELSKYFKNVLIIPQIHPLLGIK